MKCCGCAFFFLLALKTFSVTFSIMWSVKKKEITVAIVVKHKTLGVIFGSTIPKHSQICKTIILSFCVTANLSAGIEIQCFKL